MGVPGVPDPVPMENSVLILPSRNRGVLLTSDF
jgi:hypothetical protein